MATTNTLNFAQMLNNLTNCIAIYRKRKYHVRQYSRNIKNGKPRCWIETYCHYANLPTRFEEIFKDYLSGKARKLKGNQKNE